MAITALYILNEEAIGYTLFKVKEFEEIGLIEKHVDHAFMSDLSRFNSIVTLAAFSPFQCRDSALENMLSITEGNVHPDLASFLQSNVPAASKKVNVVLGVSYEKLGLSIKENLGIACQYTGVVPEILKGVKANIKDLVKGVTKSDLSTSRMGVGHAYAGCKVKFNVHKVDNMVTQSVNLLDQMDKNLNMLSMRIRESYANHFPELHKIVTDNTQYIKAVGIIGDRKTIDEDKCAQLEELLMDSSKVESIKAAAKISMGFDISIVDWSFIENMTKFTTHHYEYRSSQGEYLKDKMDVIAPNLSSLVGELVGARLISKTKSIIALASLPASTIQILGAEKALFRALKTKGNTPKYGLIYHSTFIGRAPSKHKGRISRFLANKCAIASRLDAFLDNSTTIYGETLRKQVEKRLKFYEDGEIPQPNADVMAEAYEKVAKQEKKMLKRKRKLAETSMNETSVVETTLNETVDESILNDSEIHPKKKKKMHVENEVDQSINESAKKKKKAKKIAEMEDSAVEAKLEESLEKPKKKKKVKQDEDADVSVSAEKHEQIMETSVSEEKSAKKKKAKHSEEADVSAPAETLVMETSVAEGKSKNKKKAKNGDMDVSVSVDKSDLMETSVPEEKPKKKKKSKQAEDGDASVSVEKKVELVETSTTEEKPKKKKKSKHGDDEDVSINTEAMETSVTEEKQKKKSKKSKKET